MTIPEISPMLEVQALQVAYGPRPALQSISLQVAAGEVVVIIGPNGAGKSTLIKAISGVLPYRGQVRVAGIDMATLTPGRRARRLAVVPQARQIPGAYSVYETVLMGRTPYLNWLGQPGQTDLIHVQHALDWTELEAFRDRRIGELSGGEQQRVLLARALAQDAPLLLLDEPTTHLDLQYQSNLLNLLRQLARQKNLAVLMALHDLNLASLYGDRIVILDAGRLRASGAPAQALTSETLSQVYHVPVHVIPHPDYGIPLVLPDGHGDGG